MELREILSILWRRRYVALAVFLLFFVSIAGLSLVRTPSFSSSGKVHVTGQASSVASALLQALGVGTSQSSSGVSLDMTDYLVLAKLRPVAERVVQRLDLKRERVRSRIFRAIPLLKPVLRRLGVNVDSAYKPVTAEELLNPSITGILFPVPSVEVEQYEDADVLQITGSSPDPAQAQAIALEMCRGFIAIEEERAKKDYSQVRALIDERLPAAQAELAAAQKAMEDFKRSEKSLLLDSEIESFSSRIIDLRQELEQISLDTARMTTTLAYAESRIQSLPEYRKTATTFQESEVVQSLRQTMATMYLNIANGRTRYTDDHPQMVDWRNQIEESKRLLKEQAEKTFGSETLSLDTLYEGLRQNILDSQTDLVGYAARRDAYTRMLADYEARLAAYPEKTTRQGNLMTALSSAQTIYETLLTFRAKAVVAEQTGPGNLLLREPPLIPERTDRRHRSPNTTLWVILAGFLGTAFGVAAGLMVEYVDGSILKPEHVRSVAGVPLLGVVPYRRSLGRARPGALDPATRHRFRALRALVRTELAARNARTLVITSEGPGAGKTTVALGLARELAAEGRRVVLVDGVPGSVALSAALGTPNGPGLSDVLAGASDPAAARHAAADGLTLIPAGREETRERARLESPALRSLLRDLEQTFDVVIVDTPAMEKTADALVFAEAAGAALLVAEAGRTKRAFLAEMADVAGRTRVTLLGAVLNKTGRATLRVSLG